jgi:hypothetical protein
VILLDKLTRSFYLITGWYAALFLAVDLLFLFNQEQEGRYLAYELIETNHRVQGKCSEQLVNLERMKGLVIHGDFIY